MGARLGVSVASDGTTVEVVHPRLEIATEPRPVPELDRSDRAGVEVWRDGEGAVCAWAQTIDGEPWMHLPSVASYRLRPGAREITAVPDPSAGSNLVVIGYQRTVLPMAMQLAGHQVLHASGVLSADGVVAFCAVSTTGKSTTAEGFSLRGYPVWADDAVAFDVADGSIIPVPLPFQLSPRPGSGLEEGTAAGPARAGAEPEPGPAFSALCVLERAPLGRRDQPVQVRSLSAAEAFPALLAHAYCYSLDDVERNRLMIDHYLAVSERVPVLRVSFRAGLAHLPALLDAIEREAGMAPPPGW